MFQAKAFPAQPHELDIAANNGALLDLVIEMLDLKNDAALCRSLHMMPSAISKLRHGHLSVGPALLIKLHDLTNLSINDMKHIALRLS